MNIKKRITIINILLLALSLFFMAVIFTFSAQPCEVSSHLSKGMASGILDIILKYLHISGKDSLSHYVWLEIFLRKSAHFSLYMALGFILYLLSVQFFTRIRIYRNAIVLFVCLMYAISDEAHQLFVPGRSAQFADILIDFIGSASGVFVAKYALYRIKTIKKRKLLKK